MTLSPVQRYTLGGIAACVAVAFFVGAISMCASGCTPAQEAAIVKDDKAVVPYINEACTLVEAATQANPFVTFLCTAVEGGGAILAQLPLPEAGAPTAVSVAQLYRVHTADLPLFFAQHHVVAPDVSANMTVAKSVVDAVTAPLEGGAKDAGAQ